MPVRLRLQRHGRKKAPFYVIVAADSRVKRDGKYIERIGSYNPTTVPAVIELDNDAALKWLQNGAEPTNTVKAILSYKGVLYKKHLYRGVAKGSFTQEEADKKWNEWMENREKAIMDKKSQADKAKRAEFEKVETAAKEKREKERAAKAAEKKAAKEDTPRQETGEDTEVENVANDIDSVAKQAAAERGEVADQDTPVSEALVDNNPAAADAMDAAQNTEEFNEAEAKSVAETEETTEEPKAEATEETKSEASEETKAEATEEGKEEEKKEENK